MGRQIILRIILASAVLAVSAGNDLESASLALLKSVKSVSFAETPHDCKDIIRRMSQKNFTVIDCTIYQDDVWFRIDNILTWEDSWSACRTIKGGDLASVHNVEELSLLRKLLWAPDQDHTANWIGLNDILAEGDYRWSDGSNFDYKRWMAPTSEPNGGREENCVMYQSQVIGGGCCWADGFLDMNCGIELPSICKMNNPSK